MTAFRNQCFWDDWSWRRWQIKMQIFCIASTLNRIYVSTVSFTRWSIGLLNDWCVCVVRWKIRQIVEVEIFYRLHKFVNSIAIFAVHIKLRILANILRSGNGHQQACDASTRECQLVEMKISKNLELLRSQWQCTHVEIALFKIPARDENETIQKQMQIHCLFVRWDCTIIVYCIENLTENWDAYSK